MTEPRVTARGKLPWFRVEFDADGHCVKCTPCEPSVATNGTAVIYVQASNPESARQKASRERNQLMLKARRKVYREAGLCRCGRERTGDTNQCDKCIERGRENNKRETAKRQAERAGVPFSEPRKSPQERIFQRRREVTTITRLSVLLEVQSVWQRAHNDKYFTEWLKSAIEAARKPANSEVAA